MTQTFRHPQGGRIDRSRLLSFSFNGRRLNGFSGDTLASALLANGVRVVARSFKFHRPRGILSAGVEEPNALLAVDVGNGFVPITRATLMPLMDSLRAKSQNCFPSVNFDLYRILDYTRPLWPAGFYNKVLKWPNWHFYEAAVRRAAGLGRLPGGEDAARYRHINEYCDSLIVGTGSAGLKAALAAGRRGDDVLLVEQDSEPGGTLLYDSTAIDGQPACDWRMAALEELRALDNVRMLLDATVAGYYDHNVLTIHDRSAARRGERSVETFRKVRAARVILATGAIEQPLLFGNNDLPGVMLAGAVHKYASRYAVNCGKQVVGIVNNDIGWQSLLGAFDAGTTVSAVIDLRRRAKAAIRGAATERGITVYAGAVPLRARGSSAVEAIQVTTAGGGNAELECDILAMSGGLSPTVHLYSQAGGALHYNAGLACFVPGECRQDVRVVGAANGDFATPDTYNIAPRNKTAAKSNAQWVDYQHDVTVSDIELAVRENYVSVEHLKRYTTTGMSVDQGKTSNLNAMTLLAKLRRKQPEDVGTTTYRPQFMPVTLSAIAGNRRGDFYSPPRLLAAHDWHASRAAVFDDYGGWRRPAFYGEERAASIAREARHVRESAGLFDGSPLGKIEVRGPDAAEFLNRIYVHTVSTLQPGKIRYGLMVNENGIVIDDGVIARCARDHFIVNTTSGNAARIAAWCDEWHQCEWPDLNIVLSSVTGQWAVATLAGPKSRAILQALDGMIDLSPDRFGHMSFGTGEFADGTPFRLQRVSFSGELSYELSVPATIAAEVFERLSEIGREHDLRPFGVEALMVLRTEKGFLHIGVDTDGTTNALDVGFGRTVAAKSCDFIGSRSLQRAHDRSANRRQLVGFELDEGVTVRAGAHFVANDGRGWRSEGFVTSAVPSLVLSRTVGLGLIERGFARKGEQVKIYDDKRILDARIAEPCFFDPGGERMRA